MNISSTTQSQRNRVLALIGAFKLLKGVLLVALGVGLLLGHQDGVLGLLVRLAHDVHVDPDGRHLAGAVRAIAALNGRRLDAVSGGIFVYAGLFLTEGIGLLRGKRWAEYFTVVVTGSFIPLEAFEFLRRPDGLRLVLLLANAMIVGYLVSGVARDRPPAR
jgi:uncharacterized membrane protein (DUF2068 family)